MSLLHVLTLWFGQRAADGFWSDAGDIVSCSANANTVKLKDPPKLNPMRVIELASEVVLGKCENFAHARCVLSIVGEPPSRGQDLSGRTVRGYIGEVVLETGGRSGLCSLRGLMASWRSLGGSIIAIS